MSDKIQCQCYTAVQIGTCDEDCDRMTAKKQTSDLAKQKGLEIYKLMYLVRKICASDNTKHFAKQCALIAVDEICEELESERVFEKYDFWQQVRSEIEKL